MWGVSIDKLTYNRFFLAIAYRNLNDMRFSSIRQDKKFMISKANRRKKILNKNTHGIN